MFNPRLILLVAILATTPVMAQTPSIVLATFDQEAPQLAATELVMKAVYKKLDIELQIDRHPGNRVLSLANSGKVDGVLLRATVIEDLAKNLVRIPIPIADIRYTAYVKRAKAFKINGWESLKPYKVGVLRGIKLVEEQSKHLNPEMVTSYTSLFKMLYLERIDVAIFTELDGLYALKKMDLHNDIIKLSPPLEVTPAYHFLHKKHSTLIAKMSALMHEMQQSGELQELIKQSEITVIDSLP